MKKKTKLQRSWKTNNYFLTSVITPIDLPMLIWGTKKKEVIKKGAANATPKPKKLIVTKYEISDSVVKFFDSRGFLKKRLVLIKEIPVYEITSVESFGNEVTIGWDDFVYLFVFKKKAESFTGLRDQIRDLLEKQQQNMETETKASLRKIEITSKINSSLVIVDLSFNILMGLQPKIINWTVMEAYTEVLSRNLDLNGKLLEELNVNFGSVSSAVKKHAPQTTAKETLQILKKIYGYFENLHLDDEIKDANLSVRNVKNAILAYYLLNDLMFGKVIGVLNSEKEVIALDGILLELANESNIKVSFEELKTYLDCLVVEGDNEGLIEDARLFFKDKLKLL
jgi:hypothetical protein